NHRGSKWPERFAPLDLRIENSLHVSTSRIADDRAVAERPRTPFHTPLKPAHHLAFCNLGRRASTQDGLICDLGDRAAGRMDLVLPVCKQRCNVSRLKFRTPISVIHHERTPIAQLMPYSKRCPDRAPCIARSRLHVDAPKWRRPTHFTVGHRIHGAATGE